MLPIFLKTYQAILSLYFRSSKRQESFVLHVLYYAVCPLQPQEWLVLYKCATCTKKAPLEERIRWVLEL